MLKKEILKNEDQEAENAEKPLFHPPDEKNTPEKVPDEQLKKNEVSDDDDEKSDTSEKVEEEIKQKKAENLNEPNGHNDAGEGSTTEIIQPADLKPKHLGFTRNLLLAMFAAMIGTGAQFGYALGVMNPPAEVFYSISSLCFQSDLF